jgi:hypothetical protein
VVIDEKDVACAAVIVENTASLPEILVVDTLVVEKFIPFTVEKVIVEFPVMEEKSPLFAERSLVETRKVDK